MYVYLAADSRDIFESSAYAYLVANLQVMSDKRYGWTVVEAYLHGLLDLSNFIIKKNLYQRVTEFVICTSNPLVIKCFSTDYLERAKANSWKNPDGTHLFHVPLLSELYYHRIFYKEWKVTWSALTEVGEMEYRQYERCVEQVQELLKGEQEDEEK